MVRLVVSVSGSDKWVTVEDLSGPQIKFDDVIKQDKPLSVEIHSTETTPGSVIVYAGQHRSQPTAKFYKRNFSKPCTLELSDEAVSPKGIDAKLPEKCSWPNLFDPPAAGRSRRAEKAQHDEAPADQKAETSNTG